MALVGMKGTGVFTADERPKNWRQGILLLFPNGDCPLTALSSMWGEEPTDDPEFNWFEKTLPLHRGLITGSTVTVAAQPAAGTDIAAADATAEVALRVQPDGGTDGDVSWLKEGELLTNQVTEENMLVIAVNRTLGFVIVRRDVGDKFASNPAITGGVAGVGDTIVITGNGHPEGGDVGTSINFQPYRHFNFSEIFREPLEITRTARRTKLRYDKMGAYTELKRESLQSVGLKIERAWLFGERSELTSFTNAVAPTSGTSTAKPLRTTRGLLNWLPAASTTTATPSVHWDIGTANAGVLTEVLADAFIEEIFRYGSSEKLVFGGSTFLNVLNQLAKNKMTITAVPTDKTYGMQFYRYTSPFGDLLVKQHPLMSHDPVWRRDAFVIDPAHIKIRVLDELTFLRNRQGNGVDATVDEWLFEGGLEVHFSGATPSTAGGLPGIAGPATHGRIKGVTSYGG
jgi:hypothetical protein